MVFLENPLFPISYWKGTTAPKVRTSHLSWSSPGVSLGSFPLSRSCITTHWHFLTRGCILSPFYAHPVHQCVQSLQSSQPRAQGWGSTHGVIWMQSEPQHGPWRGFPNLLTARTGCRTKIRWFCACCALSWGECGSPKGVSVAVPFSGASVSLYNEKWAFDSSRKQQPKGWSVQIRSWSALPDLMPVMHMPKINAPVLSDSLLLLWKPFSIPCPPQPTLKSPEQSALALPSHRVSSKVSPQQC